MSTPKGDDNRTEVKSFLMEAGLWTLPSTCPLLHREIEEALEKFLWMHPYAMMDDELTVVDQLHRVRKGLLQNLIWKRAHMKKLNLISALRKLEGELQQAVDAETEGGVPLPRL
jgi:hypothetical protein